MSKTRLPKNLLAAIALMPFMTMTACPDEERRPIGASCSAASQCGGSLCFGGSCLDPEADDDLDGLLNAVEAALGTDPLKADTDGDGQTDFAEVGPDILLAFDSDGDGKVDATESNLLDNDEDCIPDQQDSDDAVPEVDPAVLGQKVCSALGVCSASGVVITANCALLEDGPQLACDYSQVPDYEGPETSCNDVDNDCDGVVDNAFIAGGGTTFTDADGTTGLVKGESCGSGACADGEVVCGTTVALACSSADKAGAETCDDVDNDCDGVVDNAFVAGGTTTFTDVDGTEGLVKGDSCGSGACDGGAVVCGTTTALACSSTSSASAETCDAVDNDCDGDTDEGKDQSDCTTFYLDGDSDDYGDPNVSQCQCIAPNDGKYVTVAMDCNDGLDTYNPDAAGICGEDADCDTSPKDADEACDDANEDANDGCNGCQIADFRVNPPQTNAQHVAVHADGPDAYIVAYVEQPNAVIIAHGPDVPMGGSLPPALVVQRFAAGEVEPTRTHRQVLPLDASVDGLEVIRRGGNRYAVIRYAQTYDAELQTFDNSAVAFDFNGPDEPVAVPVFTYKGSLRGYQAVSLGAGAIAFVAVAGDANSDRVFVYTMDAENNVSAESLTLASIDPKSGSIYTMTAAHKAGGGAVIGWIESGTQGSNDRFIKLTTDGLIDGEEFSLIAAAGASINGMELSLSADGYWLGTSLYDPTSGSVTSLIPVSLDFVAGTPVPVTGPGAGEEGDSGFVVDSTGAVVAIWYDYTGQETVIRFASFAADGTPIVAAGVIAVVPGEFGVPQIQAAAGGGSWFLLAFHDYADGGLTLERVTMDGTLLYR